VFVRGRSAEENPLVRFANLCCCIAAQQQKENTEARRPAKRGKGIREILNKSATKERKRLPQK